MSLLVKSLPLLVALRTTRTLSFLLSKSKPKLKPLTTQSLSKNHAALFSVSASAETTATTTTAPNPPLPANEALHWVSRTRYCGQLTPDDVGKRVTLCGWVALHRVHGGLTFLNLRDHTGLVQVPLIFYHYWVFFSFPFGIL